MSVLKKRKHYLTWYWEAAHSQLFPRERLGLLIEITTCSIIDNMQAMVVSRMASGLIFQCHETFYLEYSQMHADMYIPWWIGFCYPQVKLTLSDYDNDDDDHKCVLLYLEACVVTLVIFILFQQDNLGSAKAMSFIYRFSGHKGITAEKNITWHWLEYNLRLSNLF